MTTSARPAPHAAPAAAPAPADVLDATQRALRAEHAAVYGYGVVGGRIGEDRRKEAREGHDAHRARRDALHRRVRDLGGEPEPSAAAYALPFPVPDADAAARLAAELEDRVAGVYADLVRAATGDTRREAAGALREAAVRAVRWRGGSVAFPGLAERPAPAGSPGPATGGASEL
ncbi:ferritin-like domain-containing protein [Streptomyces zingiberis]|uniref:Ferritin-like domain-containing protein n=1 Tax=Streptomyces zingiberis TaxID=2053010 RepID=A0ABX1BX85_9ACTN|nr:ferritin-like domain-containing protein [Streptomyces zingiberis]NJQ02241.1 ferritin-like domain-containing protein [Streptomyces zingiberis]